MEIGMQNRGCKTGNAKSNTVAVQAFKFALYALFAGYLVFAHGCHGDEDNELLCRAAAVSPTR